MSEPREVWCPYCGAQAEWLPDSAVYASSYGGMVYVCQPCKAWCGCHKRKDGQPGTHPLGRLADAELRRMKIRGHALMDPIWKAAMAKRGWTKKRARGATYRWLAKETGIPEEQMHWGMLGNEDCQKAIAFLEGFYARIAARKG
jgi:hypothetical protein